MTAGVVATQSSHAKGVIHGPWIKTRVWSEVAFMTNILITRCGLHNERQLEFTIVKRVPRKGCASSRGRQAASPPRKVEGGRGFAAIENEGTSGVLHERRW